MNTNQETKKPAPVLFYFGCLHQSGHYLFEPPGVSVRGYTEIKCMSQALRRSLDTAFCPPETWQPGIWLESMVPPWRIVSWWDRSVDSRPGSHSTFIGAGYDSAEELLTAARNLFPQVFARQRVQIRKGLAFFDWEHGHTRTNTD